MILCFQSIKFYCHLICTNIFNSTYQKQFSFSYARLKNRLRNKISTVWYTCPKNINVYIIIVCIFFLTKLICVYQGQFFELFVLSEFISKHWSQWIIFMLLYIGNIKYICIHISKNTSSNKQIVTLNIVTI